MPPKQGEVYLHEGKQNSSAIGVKTWMARTLLKMILIVSRISNIIVILVKEIFGNVKTSFEMCQRRSWKQF